MIGRIKNVMCVHYKKKWSLLIKTLWELFMHTHTREKFENFQVDSLIHTHTDTSYLMNKYQKEIEMKRN